MVELLGEDRRLLFREVKNVRTVPAGSWVPLKMALDYEISAAAEAGRLQIYVADQNTDTTALSSIPLILLSIGQADIYPVSGLAGADRHPEPAKEGADPGRQGAGIRVWCVATPTSR